MACGGCHERVEDCTCHDAPIDLREARDATLMRPVEVVPITADSSIVQCQHCRGIGSEPTRMHLPCSGCKGAGVHRV